MRKLLYLGFAAIVALALNGCGGHSDPVFVAQILSDPGVDGDIAEDIDTGILSSPVLASGTGSVRVGIDPSIGLFGTEYRGFLHFPLDGSTGFDAVPADATIVSATLEIFIDTVQFSPTVPVRMDLVWFPPPLISSDYDVTVLPSLLTRGTFNILSTDPIPPRVGVLIDVTPLMREAQRLGLADFQVRFLLDPLALAGFVGIEDLPNFAVTAPLLIVEYR